ncbi:hypothetical protein BP5796_12749 [Coleophoma crateriformis]|uniref:Uncharacterized protein n=1 Tax=Coleophoma crateriformis TaxID=565419 RepID=A0A3D8Q667_9HELO|nr:hypothetical protein BP5796_12749 [Coleophoma crateriformis]
MESGTEVLRVTAAIVSAFQTAAEALEVIKDRKDKKKRKKDKEVEELVEIRILHRSLVEGGTRCRKHCENRHQQFSPTFENGDNIALLALKDVLISLQTEVIQPLYMARAVESAVLDFTTLHESSITNRRDATGAMDQLCQRIVASMQFQQQHGVDLSEARSPSDSSMRSSVISIQPSDLNEYYDLPLSPSGSVGHPRQTPYQRGFHQRTLSDRDPSNDGGQRGRYNAPQASPLSWINARVQYGSDDLAARDAPSAIMSEEQSHQGPEYFELERRNQFSTQYSAVGDDRGSVNLQPASPTSATTPRNPQDPLSSSQEAFKQSPQFPQQQPAATDGTAILAHGTRRQNSGGSFGDEAEILSTVSQTTKPRPPSRSPMEPAETSRCAFEAPEVALMDFGSMYTITPRPDKSSEKYPAFRTQADYAELLLSLPVGINDIWVPLPRPALHNRYHGFCKGAWQIRKAVHEGLEVQVTPTLQEPVIHWACKACKFRSRAPNEDALPNLIIFNQKYGIRYRWLFLAKSHRGTESSCDMIENYKYGCIFCAAQGQKSPVHDKLDHLMVHIISKHKSHMMPLETRKKTKCIVGNVANREEDWDINIPESDQKGPGIVANEFFISVSKLFNEKRGKRS